jgi:hypothetical protein
MIHFDDGARAGEQTAMQFTTSPIVMVAILASLPAARELARSWAETGDAWQREVAAYWSEFYDSFESTTRAAIDAAAGRS